MKVFCLLVFTSVFVFHCDFGCVCEINGWLEYHTWYMIFPWLAQVPCLVRSNWLGYVPRYMVGSGTTRVQITNGWLG
uniref:Putative ovule protein n=1 Tax=Solanum chacoense TaxID=4108 RepID=A0A0V0HHK9_SOLCH